MQTLKSWEMPILTGVVVIGILAAKWLSLWLTIPMATVGVVLMAVGFWFILPAGFYAMNQCAARDTAENANARVPMPIKLPPLELHPGPPEIEQAGDKGVTMLVVGLILIAFAVIIWAVRWLTM